MIEKIKLFLFLFNSKKRIHLYTQDMFKDTIFIFDGSYVENNSGCATIKISKNFNIWKKETKILITK